MDQETTHARISKESAKLLNDLAELTGIARTRLLDEFVTGCISAINADEPLAELPIITKLRVMVGKDPFQARMAARLEVLEKKVANIAPGSYGTKKK